MIFQKINHTNSSALLFIPNLLKGFYLQVYLKCVAKQEAQALLLYVDSKPVTLLIYGEHKRNSVSLLYLFTDEQYRHKGYAKALFSHFCQLTRTASILLAEKSGYKQDACSTENIEEYTWHYIILSLMDDQPYIQQIINTYPIRKMNQSKFVYSTLFNETNLSSFNRFLLKYYGKLLKLPADYHLKSLSDLSGTERQHIQDLKQNLESDVFYPLNDEFMTGSNPSMIILKESIPLAWITFRQFGSNAMYIHSLYVMNDYRNAGFPVFLIYHSLNQLPIICKYLSFYIRPDNHKIKKIIDRFNFIHFTVKREETFEITCNRRDDDQRITEDI
ncbi:MAG TPA: GNAT family N-acetyltransferase [Candidatus Cloacimonadota bacterium]|nr:GNAT family N-acetyltransferase [Candidatus Cloacimonadota bacterium]